MTSKHCFSSMMKENMRHQIWLVVLSILGNTLSMPALYLLTVGGQEVYDNRYALAAHEVSGFATTQFMIPAGVIALMGCLMVAVSGFQYLHSRKKEDLYESLPIKRRDLFLVNWLNGFLIWFVPFVCNLFVMYFMAFARYSRMKKNYFAYEIYKRAVNDVEWLTGPQFFCKTMLTGLALVLAFLVVYNLVILAMTLTGNPINTLAVAGTIGVGVIGFVGLFNVMIQLYLETWMGEVPYGKIAILSPLANLYRLAVFQAHSAPTALYVRVLLENLLVAVLLFAAAYLCYLKRPTEMAGQGLKSKYMRYPIQILVTVCAIMAGWILMTAVVESFGNEEFAAIWAIFGGLLAGAFVFGVLDIIFQLDFKAFFKHKLLMLCTVAAGLLFCIGMATDLFGYDSYLPDKNNIAEMSLFSKNYSSYDRYWATNPELKELLDREAGIKDQDMIYALLQKAVAPIDYSELYAYPEERICVKVTLKSGRSYYRTYEVVSSPELQAVLDTIQYRDLAYKIKDREKETFVSATISRNDASTKITNKDVLYAISEAYNRDLREKTIGELETGIALGRITFTSMSDDAFITHRFYITEGMVNTVQTLRENGYEDMVSPYSAKNVRKVFLSMRDVYDLKDPDVDMFERMESYFGVDLKNGEYMTNYGKEGIKSMYRSGELPPVVYQLDTDEYASDGWFVEITDEKDVQEILNLTSCIYNYDMASPWTAEIYLSMKNGETYLLPSYELLPEKYLVSFLAEYFVRYGK